MPGVHGWEQFQKGQEHQLKHSGVPAAPLSLQCHVGSTAVPTRGSTQLHTQQGATPWDGPTAQPGAKQGRGTCTRQTDERWSQRSAVSITTNTALYGKGERSSPMAQLYWRVSPSEQSSKPHTTNVCHQQHYRTGPKAHPHIPVLRVPAAATPAALPRRRRQPLHRQHDVATCYTVVKHTCWVIPT